MLTALSYRGIDLIDLYYRGNTSERYGVHRSNRYLAGAAKITDNDGAPSERVGNYITSTRTSESH